MSELIGKTVDVEFNNVMVMGVRYTDDGVFVMVKIKDQELWFNMENVTETKE